MTEENICVLKVIDGVHFLFMPDGTKIPKQKSNIVVQNLKDAEEKYAWCRVTLLVKLEDSK